jgi:ribose transport system permease protein
MAVFGFFGLTAAIAGVLKTSRLTLARPTACQGAEPKVLAIVVLGSASLFGGRGGIGGNFITVLLLSVLKNLFSIMGVGTFLRMVVTGPIHFVALVLNKFIDFRVARIS